MKKNILKVSALLLIMLSVLAISVFAYSATITLEPSVKQVKEGNEFTVKVGVANIEAGQGLAKIDAVLNYDENEFNPVEDTNIEALNGWKVTYNAAQKQITATNQQFVKTNSPVFQISFKVKSAQPSENNNNNGTVAIATSDSQQPAQNKEAKIELTNIQGSNGLEQFAINPVSTTVTIGEQSVAQEQPVVQQQQPAPVIQPVVEQPKVEKTPVQIPDAGLNDAPVILMIALMIVAVGSLVALKVSKK